MSKLYLKGVQKPITITTSQARNLNLLYENSLISPKKSINLDGLRFNKEDIKYIIENDVEDNMSERSDAKKVENDGYYNDVNTAFTKEVARLCDLSVEEKSNDTRLYQLAWAGFSMSPVAPEFLEEVKTRQRTFFEAHPTYPYASISVVDLLPKEKSEQDSVREFSPAFVSSKINSIVAEAYRTAKFIGKI
jgi:hypothetical protein